MFKDKPVISNQYGALIMAFVPFLYALFTVPSFHWHLILFGIAWLFLYLFSYPFFSLFSKKPSERNKKWAIIYFILSLLFAFPILLNNWQILLFILPFVPLGWIQFYYAKKRDERNIINDIAGILTFSVVGMAAYYLADAKLNWAIFFHPALFFIATTLYVKSIVRERKNPLYMELSVGLHILLALGYLLANFSWIFTACLFALARAIIVPSMGWNVKQVGMFEFLTTMIFLVSVILE